LTKNDRGRLVAVQSSLDSIEVKDNKIKKEDEDGFEALEDRLARIGTILAKIQTAEQVGAGQPATRSESESGGDEHHNPESEGRSR